MAKLNLTGGTLYKPKSEDDEQMERVFKIMEKYAESHKGQEKFDKEHGLMTYDEIMNYLNEQRKKWYANGES